jgi:hypothetical protein
VNPKYCEKQILKEFNVEKQLSSSTLPKTRHREPMASLVGGEGLFGSGYFLV